MKANDVMTPNPVTVFETATLLEVVNLLLNLKISGLPVIDNNRYVTGVITEGDLLRRSEIGTEVKHSHWKEIFIKSSKLADEYIKSNGLHTKELMTTTPVTVNEFMDLDEVISLMENFDIKRLPVVNNSNQLVGIITRADILKALRVVLEEKKEGFNSNCNISDNELRKLLLDEIDMQHWAPLGNIRITVNSGVVEIFGIIYDESFRQAIVTLVEKNADGYMVCDHMVYIEPITGLYIDSKKN